MGNSRTGRARFIPLHVELRFLSRLKPTIRGHLQYQPVRGKTHANRYRCLTWGYDGQTYGVQAHVMAARIFKRDGGSIHVDEEVHHTCGLPGCCDPDHLEILTREKHIEEHARGRAEKRAQIEEAVERALEDTYGDDDDWTTKPRLV